MNTNSLLELKTVYAGRVITVNVETVRLPNGHVADGWIWELPAGKLEPKEPALKTAQRELIEEAGFEGSDWVSLGDYVSSPGVFTETVKLFMAQGLTPSKMAHEAAELIEVHWVPIEEACRRAVAGELNDGKSALGLLRAQARLAEGTR
jgi:ADP-ribose pyrophosphatase